MVSVSWLLAGLGLVRLVGAVEVRDVASMTKALLAMPDCARHCLLVTVGDQTACEFTNQTCICDSTAINDAVTVCVKKSCSVKQQLTTMNITQTMCDRPLRDRGKLYQVVTIVMVIFSSIFIVQRFAFKLYARLGLGLDDWFVLLTLLAGIPATIINAHFLMINGIGRDIWTLQSDQVTNFSLYFYIDEIIYLAEVSLAKLAMLFFYMKIFPSQHVQRLLWGTIIFNAAFGVAFVLVAIFQCKPLTYFWVMWDGEHQGQCMNINAITWSNAIISIAMDIWMLAIPLWQLKSLKLGFKKKIGVATMFCVGAFVTIVSILRLKSLIAFSYSTDNPTWDFADVGMWSDIEINVSMICVCLPTFRLLLVRLFPQLKETTQRYYKDRPTDDNTRGTARSRRGGNSQSGIDGDSSVEDGKKIWYQKTFTVKYAEADEMQLVSMRDQDRTTSAAHSETSLG